MLYLFVPCGLLFWLCRINDGFIQLLRKMPRRFTAVFIRPVFGEKCSCENGVSARAV